MQIPSHTQKRIQRHLENMHMPKENHEQKLGKYDDAS